MAKMKMDHNKVITLAAPTIKIVAAEVVMEDRVVITVDTMLILKFSVMTLQVFS